MSAQRWIDFCVGMQRNIDRSASLAIHESIHKLVSHPMYRIRVRLIIHSSTSKESNILRFWFASIETNTQTASSTSQCVHILIIKDLLMT